MWSGMTHRGLPFVALSAVGGIGSLALMARRRYRMARMAAAVAVGGVLWGWGAAQWPHLILPDLTAGDAAAPAATLRMVVVGYLIGGAILLPSLLALFRVFKASRAGPGG
jgi:cytochrome d ubiquinol oxidase subunit II